MFKTKAFDVTIQGAGEGELKEGQFKALVSTYNPDSYGDVVSPGAFADSIAEWDSKGLQIPVIWSHDWADPFSHIGVVQHAEETDRGLVVTGYIDPVDLETNPKAAQIWRLMKARRVTQFSFAFDVVDGSYIQRDGQEYYELRKMKIHEVGPCLLGVNQESELLAAKARELKEGSELGPAALKSLQEAYETIGRILDITPGEENIENLPESKTVGEGGKETDDPASSAAESASDEQIQPADILQRLDIELAIAEEENCE